MHLTEKFSSILMSHLMQLSGIPSRLGVLIKGLQEEEFLCANGYYRFFSGVVRLGVAGNQTSVIAAWTRCLKRVEHDCKAWSRHGLSEVENVCIGRDIPELRALFYGYVNSNGILYR